MDWRIERHEELTSTSDEALRRGRAGEPEGLVVVAGRQTAGRGRSGGGWASPLGGLWLSLLLRPELRAAAAQLLSQAAALALYPVLAPHLPVLIKPPNDLYARGRKFGGILVETEIKYARVNLAVTGIGLNVNFPREQLPPELRETATTMFSETGRVFSQEKLLDELLKNFDEVYQLLPADPLELRDRYLALVTAHPAGM